MSDVKRVKTKTERFQMLLMPDDDKSRSAFVPKPADGTDSRTVTFMLVMKKINLHKISSETHQ